MLPSHLTDIIEDVCEYVRCVCVCVVDIRGVEISRYMRYTYRDPYVEDSALTQRRSINEILQLVWSHALTWKQTKRYFRM